MIDEGPQDIATGGGRIGRVRVIARGYVLRGKEAQARELFRSMLSPTRAEPGCVFYDYYESVPGGGRFFDNQADAGDDRTEIYVDELWADRAAQEAHSRTAYFAQLSEGLGAVIDGEFHVATLVEIDPAQ